jgi:hypothetical protein
MLEAVVGPLVFALVVLGVVGVGFRAAVAARPQRGRPPRWKRQPVVGRLGPRATAPLRLETQSALSSPSRRTEGWGRPLLGIVAYGDVQP